MSEDVTRWLEQNGLGKYADAFDENDVDVTDLPLLSEDDLREIGLPVGPRRRFLAAVTEAPSADRDMPTPSPMAESISTSGAAERRQLTVMFCDLVGSTELSQQLDPEDLSEINRAYQDACKAAIDRYDGYLARYMGDGVMAYFGHPQAHEDDAERAVHSGLAVVELVTTLNASVGKKYGVELSVRVGIATGPVVVGDQIGEGSSQESAVVGETPNLAARLQGIAANNNIVVGPGTHELARERFAYDELGMQSLKGIAEPVPAWRVIGPASAESRFEAGHRTGLTPLVGREHEIGLLLDRWTQAKDGDGQVVLLSGEPGIGKSRITETLLERTASDDPVRLRYQCSPYHKNSALHPIIERLEREAKFDSAETNEVNLGKLELLLEDEGTEVESVVPLFAALLAIPTEGRYPAIEMSPERQREATLEVIVAHMEAATHAGQCWLSSRMRIGQTLPHLTCLNLPLREFKTCRFYWSSRSVLSLFHPGRTTRTARP